MADEGGQRSFGSSSFDFDVVFRDDISEILAKVDSKLASDVVDEMVDVYDMSTLLDIRLKMFGYAKKKLLVNVKRTGNEDMDPVFGGAITPGSYDDAQAMVDEWSLIARKGKPRVAIDTIDFLSYVSGDCPFFPYKNIKKTTKKSKNRRGGRRNSQPGKKQTLISFTPANPEPSKPADGNSIICDNPYAELDTGEDDNDTQSDESEAESSGISESESLAEGTVSDRIPDVLHDETTPNVSTHIDRETSSPCSTADAEPRCPSGPMHSDTMSKSIVTTADPKSVAVQSDSSSVHAQSDPNRDPAPLHASLPTEKHVVKSPASAVSQSSSQNASCTSIRPIAMASQTEWDLWGSPLTDGRTIISPTKPSSQCSCEYNVRLLLDWKREVEKRYEASHEQEKARSNYL